MDRKKTLRYLQTRRFTGRRGVTPIKTKQKRTIPKTRSHRVETKPYVPLREHTGSHESSERQAADKEKQCEDPKREGDQISCLDGEWQNKEECEKAQSEGNTENSTESIHPGPIQTVYTLSPDSADDKTYEETRVESEVIP
jgi:hypothetical protein